MKDLWQSSSRFWKNQARVRNGQEPDPDSFRPQNQRSRPQNPQQTRAQPPVERGWADKADGRPPLRGPGGWGGDWYVWHAPDGPRARAATALGCVQAGAKKLGVIEASYASAIIGVLSAVSSHCIVRIMELHRFRRRSIFLPESPSRPRFGPFSAHSADQSATRAAGARCSPTPQQRASPCWLS